jgi:hypothetical protein
MSQAEDKIRQCYGIDDDRQALSCVKREVAEFKGECKPRLVLLVKKGCEGCAESKDQFREDIKAGTVRPVDITSEEGKHLARLNGISTVPSFLVLDCTDKAIV